MTNTKPTGSARLQDGNLTITVQRGKRLVTTVYRVQDLRPHQRVASVAFRLTKPSGEAYDVAQEPWGPSCSCADQTYRRERLGGYCKHILSCRSVGLLPGGRQ